MIIDPRGMHVLEWTDRMNPILSSLGSIPRLDDPKNWKKWVLRLVQEPNIAGFGPPRPEYYDDWTAWAEDFNKVLPPGVQS